MILTDEQRAVVEAKGNFLLLACPGSGKTRSGAERAARLVAARGTKVAVCSYTNVGAERIGRVLATELGVTLDQENFLGTIHRFLLRFVVHPFAHLVGAKRGPFVHESDWPDVRVHNDNKQRLSLDQFRYRADGTLVGPENPRGIKGTAEEIMASVEAEVKRRKGGFFREAGLITADDAMWVAVSILRRHPAVADAVAGRFDELLLDEAQDTSELQLACLEILHATGRLGSLALLGDVEQSIYSFMGASEEQLERLAAERGLRTLELTENHRCSQRICDVARHFCARGVADTAVGPHRDCPIEPEVVLYAATQPVTTMDAYRGRLAHHGIDPAQATVLARNWRVVDALNGQTQVMRQNDRSHLLGRLASRLSAGTLTRRDVGATQRMLAYGAWDRRPNELDDAQRDDLRRATSSLLGGLPPLSGDLHSWVTSARDVLHDALEQLCNDAPVHPSGHLVRAKHAWSEHQALEVFAPAAPDLDARTVHAFKGEDSEAVMVVIRRGLANDPTAQMELWEAAVSGTQVAAEKAEERRVVFVALTRAQRYCLVALPDDRRGRDVADKCATLGFRAVKA